LWELAACVDGFNRANGAGEPDEELSVADFRDMVRRHAASMMN
jgi:hypothetical protein